MSYEFKGTPRELLAAAKAIEEFVSDFKDDVVVGPFVAKRAKPYIQRYKELSGESLEVGWMCKAESSLCTRVFYGETRAEAEQKMEDSGFLRYQTYPLYAAALTKATGGDDA